MYIQASECVYYKKKKTSKDILKSDYVPYSILIGADQSEETIEKRPQRNRPVSEELIYSTAYKKREDDFSRNVLYFVRFILCYVLDAIDCEDSLVKKKRIFPVWNGFSWNGLPSRASGCCRVCCVLPIRGRPHVERKFAGGVRAC